MTSDHSLSITGDVSGSAIVTGEHNLVIQAQQVMLQAAQKAKEQGRDPAHMLRVLTLLAAPVLDPQNPEILPEPLDLRTEWRRLEQAVRGAQAPILLTRLVPPALDAMRRELSPRVAEQGLFPHVLHFSGHAWSGGLLLEDEFGQAHRVTTAELLAALTHMPQPLDLVVLNGCETAADARSAAQALMKAGLARAVLGHPRPVLDDQAIAFARTLYTDLTDGYPLAESVERAQWHITPHDVVLLGDGDLCFKEHLRPGTPVVDDRRPPGRLPSRQDFFGRGHDLVEIARALDHRPCLIVLSGPPGIGKSALLLEAAHRNAWRFPGGVTFAEPHPESGQPGCVDKLLADLADGLNITVPTDQVEQALLAHTAFQPTLLLLDNVESLPEAEIEELRRFLERLGGESAALIASRSPLQSLHKLPTATPYPLHHGLEGTAAQRYLFHLAEVKRIPLTPDRAEEIVQATDGHPQLLELLVARAGERDLGELLKEVRQRKGDFQAQLERVYDWCAQRAGEEGCHAWSLLPLFPAGRAPERPLRALAGEAGLEALRRAALADFDPQQQAWTWHATVSEYARAHWPLQEEEQLALLRQALPAWAEWLKGLAGDEAIARLEAQRTNLEQPLQAAPRLGRKAAWDFLKQLDKRLPAPDRTLALRAMQEPLYRAMLALAADEAEKARAQGMLGYALSALGRHQEALAATQEAVEIHRKLAQDNPQAFLPDLAASLNNLGAMLSNLGRHQEALAATQEAVEIRRKLAQANPQAFLPDLARSLNNLGRDLSNLGRHQEALAATQEAVEIHRKLAQDDPQAFLPYLATSLNNLGAMLSKLGQHQKALAATQEAVGFYRKLSQDNPQAFLPDLATSLNNLGAMLSDLGRHQEALTATQEAVEIYRKLAQDNPQAFLPDLARSLNNLGAMLSDLGRHQEALTATQEAVEIRRKLAQANPQAFLPDLAASLNNLGNCLSDLGQHQEALAATLEAVGFYRKLAHDNPQAFLPDLATSLNNLGIRLSKLQRHQEALAATQEAVGFYRKLAHDNPQAFLPYLAASLNNLGRNLSALRQWEEALAATQEAVGFYRKLAQDNPQAFLPDLAMSLNNLGSDLSKLGRHQEALAATLEAVEIRRKLARANPQAFLPDLARSLGTYGTVLLGLDRTAEAAGVFYEGLQTLLPFLHAYPQAFGRLAQNLLQDYLRACEQAGQPPDAALVQAVRQELPYYPI